MRRALLIACSSYSDPEFGALRYPANDVESVRALLADPAFGHFDTVDVLTDPTKAKAHRAIEQLTRSAARDDLILLYFSGHGHPESEGGLALVLSDTEEAFLDSTGLSADNLRKLFNGSRAIQKVVVLDCCYAGAAGEQGFKGEDDPRAEMARKLEGTFLLAAATKFQQAWELSELESSVFTHSLVQGVRSRAAVLAGSSSVSLGELAAFVQLDVPRTRPGQKPKYWDYGGIGQVVFSNLPRHYDDRWRKTTLAGLANLLAHGDIDDELFDELRTLIRAKGERSDCAQFELVDALATGSMKPFEFLRAWHARLPQPPTPAPVVLEKAPASTAAQTVRRPLDIGMPWLLPQKPFAEAWIATELVGHDAAISTVAFSPNGAQVLTAGHDGTARLWDGTTGRALRSLRHGGYFHHAAWSADGSRVATGSKGGSATIWNAASGAQEHTLDWSGDTLGTIVFSPDRQRLLTTTWDYTFKHMGGVAVLWDVGSGRCLHIFDTRERATSAAFAPDGSRVATGLLGGAVALWNVASGRLLQRLSLVDESGQSEVKSMAFSPDGRRLTGACRSVATIMDSGTGQVAVRLEGDPGSEITHLSYSPDGRWLLVCHTGGADIRDAATGETASVLKHDSEVSHERVIQRGAFSPDSRRVATAGADATVRLWSVADGGPLATLRHGDRLYDVRFSPDGARLITGGDEPIARIWSKAPVAELLRTWKPTPVAK